MINNILHTDIGPVHHHYNSETGEQWYARQSGPYGSWEIFTRLQTVLIAMRMVQFPDEECLKIRVATENALELALILRHYYRDELSRQCALARKNLRKAKY
jgi:hypothetical protein